MAYDKRISELKDQLNSAAPGPDDPAIPPIRTGLTQYAEIRSAALDDLVELINDSTVGASGIQSHWQSRVQHAREEMDRAFHDPVPDALQAFWTGMVQAEINFWDKLAAVQTPTFIENLLTHQGNLAQMIDKLKTIWEALLSADKDQETAQMKPVKELDEMMQNLAQEIEKQNQALIAETTVQLQTKMKEKAEKVKEKLKEKLGDRGTAAATAAYKIAISYLKDLIGIPSELDNDIEFQKAKFKTYLEKLAAFSKGYRDHVAQYRDLMSTQKGGVLTMFKQTREQVTEYEKNNGLVVAQIMRDEAKRFLNEWAGNTVNAQRDDAAEFNAKIFNVIDKNWKVTEEMAKQFEEKFSGVFYSPLTSDTLETLTEKYMFRQAIDSINNRNLAATVDSSQKLLSGAVDDMVTMAVQPLESMSTDWSSDLKEAARISNEPFRAYLKEKLKSQIDLAVNSLGELRFLIDPPKVVADFTREELEAMLRG